MARTGDYEANWFWLQKENIPLYLDGDNWRDSKLKGFSLQLVAHLICSMVFSTGTASGTAALSGCTNGYAAFSTGRACGTEALSGSTNGYALADSIL
jgi:hypothetical protein